MNQKEAFNKTIELAIKRNMSNNPNSTLGLSHLLKMQTLIHTFTDESKIGRWLGWAQAALIANNIATLDEMKTINTNTINNTVPIHQIKINTLNHTSNNITIDTTNNVMKTNLLHNKECENIMLQPTEWWPTSFTGMRGNYIPGDKVWSYRYNFQDNNFAQKLWDRIQHHNIISLLTSIDNEHGNDNWKPIGLSNVFRVIKYPNGGGLTPHYDSSFVYDDNHRTLLSLVINISGGNYPTRFLTDEQGHLPVTQRDLVDKNNRKIIDKDILLTECNQWVLDHGDAIIFPHHRLHDSSPVGIEGKLIVRSDIIFERQS